MLYIYCSVTLIFYELQQHFKHWNIAVMQHRSLQKCSEGPLEQINKGDLLKWTPTDQDKKKKEPWCCQGYHLPKVQPEINWEGIKERYLLQPTTLHSLNWNRLAHKRDVLWGLDLMKQCMLSNLTTEQMPSLWKVGVGGWWPWDAVKIKPLMRHIRKVPERCRESIQPRLFVHTRSATNNL